jgi:uncharacterized protein (DUF608 family)
MGLSRHDSWPVLTRYDAAHLRRVALPLGGIGTGTVSLGGRGDLRDWEVANRPAKGFTPARGFFALRTQTGDAVTTRALEGPIDPADYEGAHGSPVPNHGLPRFRNARFEVAYPLGQVVLDDADVPLQVRLQAFNPLLPTDARSSGIPGAVLRYVLHNPTDAPVTATVCGSLPNFIGNDGTNGKATGGHNEFRSEGALRGVFCRSDEVEATAEQFGTMALSALAADGDEVSHRTAWLAANWGTSLLDFWDDLVEDGRLQDPERPEDQPTASLAVTRTVPAGESTEITFLLTWHFPNRTVWEKHETPENTVGNYYGTVWADAWAVATELAERADELESRTVEFVSAVCSSDVPVPVLDAALSNISTLRTQTCFRTADGRFFGWEGCSDKEGSCFGNCTHVWNYEPATAHLFGDLARSMREIEFAYGTDENGLMSFRVQLPLDRNPREWALAAADGQMGCLIKLFREWRLSGDDEMLRALWPAARKALEFCWIPGGWDADQDGVMEGCQHDTMDVEFYGPNPQIGCWYLGALRAASEMAGYLGEAEFAAHCQDLFSRGSKWIDENLFNGRWYEQHIRPARSIEDVAPNLRLINVGAADVTDPDLQIGPGCLTDQLVGDAAAQLSGLGALLDDGNATRALDSVVTYNRISGVQGHFNHMRTYVLGEETALLICTYPDGGRPKNPFPYAHEAWTGLEYSAAIGLLQHGRTEQAVEVVRDVRDRYDGWRRSPFDEAECGHHYARAMASWGVLLAFTGFGYEARTGRLQLRGQDGVRWFFSTGNAWGTAVQRHSADGLAVEIEVHGGSLRLDSVELAGLGSCQLPESATLTAGDTVTVTGARG